MNDDKTNADAGDDLHIDLHASRELKDWSNRFNVTPEQLVEAVNKVGTSVDALEAHFSRRLRDFFIARN